MKKTLFFIGLLFLSGGLKAQDKVTIDGNIEGLDSKKMYLIISKANETRYDSIMVNNGSFHYEGPAEPGIHVNLATGVERVIKRIDKNSFLPCAASTIQLFLSPGAKIKITGKISDFADAYPSGEEANNTLASINKAIYPLINESANLYLKQRSGESTDAPDQKKRMGELGNQIYEIKRQAIFNNPNSAATLWLLSDMMLRRELNNEDAMKVFSKVSAEKFASNSYYREIKNRLEGQKATAIGEQVPEIIVEKDYKGQAFRLSSLKGKYVVLDFWGTWCHPCVSGMPKMKEYQDKYKDKLILVGIANDNMESWKNWLDANPGYQWTQVLDSEKTNLIPKFNISGYPTKIIISPEGKILEKFVGETDDIYTKLDQLLAKS